MKNIVRITGLTLIICIFHIVNCFALQTSTFYREESSTSYGFQKIESCIVLNQIMNLQNIKVKFTQDDNNYMFHITANTTINVYKDYGASVIGSYTSAPAPLLYSKENFGAGLTLNENGKTPFADYKNGTLYRESDVYILNSSIANYINKYTIKSDGSITNKIYEQNNNGEKYFIPSALRNRVSARSYVFSGASSYPINCENNGTGVSILSNGSWYQYSLNDVKKYKTYCIENLDIHINCKIAINKAYMKDYKYVCFAQSEVLCTELSVAGLLESVHAISICSQTINLEEYVDCDHDWTLLQGDRLNHIRYCKNCEWKKSESHELLYEYDGIKRNVCTCSYIDKVHYYFNINDDNINEITALLDSNSPYTKFEYTKKKGYKFKYYNKYEKEFLKNDKLSTVSNAIYDKFIATCSELDDETAMRSVIYDAQYDVNHFAFLYSNINNKNLELNDKIEKQTISYDEKSYLKKNIKMTGYAFKGWSLMKAGENVDLPPLKEITNYTDVDLAEITIYPVYKNLDFYISYSAGSGQFSDGSKNKTVSYTYFDNSELEHITLNSRDDYVIGYQDQDGNKYNNMAQVKKYIDDNELDGFTLKLAPIIGRDQYGRAERTDDEKDKDDEEERKFYDSPLDFVEESDDEIDEEKDKIYGMSYTVNNATNDKKNKSKYRKGEVLATLSFIRKPSLGNDLEMSKIEMLKNFIENHLLLSIAGASLLLILLVVYEISVIRHYLKHLSYAG